MGAGRLTISAQFSTLDLIVNLHVIKFRKKNPPRSLNRYHRVLIHHLLYLSKGVEFICKIVTVPFFHSCSKNNVLLTTAETKTWIMVVASAKYFYS